MKTQRPTHPNPLVVAASLLCDLTCRELLGATAFPPEAAAGGDRRDRTGLDETPSPSDLAGTIGESLGLPAARRF